MRAEASKGERARSGSGRRPIRYELVREILLGYLSPILVDSVLDKALRDRSMTPSMLSPTSLAELTSDIMVGLRLFVEEDQLAKLMIELAAVLEGDDP
jgi:hypothetical protein